VLASGWLATQSAAGAAAPRAVTTYHYDNLRTGWNHSETVLSAASFPATFGILQTVTLDDQVDAQPLLVPGLQIAGGVHDVVYVVTQNNSVYAIDASSGIVLLQRNLGPPVPRPLSCGNNGPAVGITSTPVIDLKRGLMYLIAYLNGTNPTYQIYALNLTTLADGIAPRVARASQTLTDGTTFHFNARYQRQRPGLLEFNGAIYAGFGSFCDFSANLSRGWVLGWRAGTLNPLAHAELNDSQATSPTSFFLSSVWMSGYGVAAANNEIFFSTGNSDCDIYSSPELCPSSPTFDGVTNIQESVVGMQPDLSQRAGVFTPGNFSTLDFEDKDLGAGGVLLVPTQPGSWNLAAIVSKDGRLFLLDRDNLTNALDMHQLSDGCWCGPSYFHGSDGIGRVVSSAGDTLQTWQIQTSPSPVLVAEASGTVQRSAQDPGFFTVVSSNAGNLNSAIIWAVARITGTQPLTLYAFAAAPQSGTLKLLYSSPAGQWANIGGNANIVPVVANGKVYVAAYKTLTIFGPNGAPASAAASVNAVRSTADASTDARLVTGKLVAVNDKTLLLTTRYNETVSIDISRAVESQRISRLVVGQAYTVRIAPAAFEGASMEAESVTRAKRGTAAWPEDRK
jgi:outer membrane protein assembly factor BamB